MTQLIVTRGLPGAGKTALAETWRNKSPDRARVSRDALRAMLAGSGRWRGSDITEAMITQVQESVISVMLAHGLDVIADDTNLDPVHVVWLENLAHAAGARFGIADLTGEPIGDCLARNSERPDPTLVPDEWIIRAYARWISGQPNPLPYPFRYDGTYLTSEDLLAAPREIQA